MVSLIIVVTSLTVMTSVNEAYIFCSYDILKIYSLEEMLYSPRKLIGKNDIASPPVLAHFNSFSQYL